VAVRAYKVSVTPSPTVQPPVTARSIPVPALIRMYDVVRDLTVTSKAIVTRNPAFGPTIVTSSLGPGETPPVPHAPPLTDHTVARRERRGSDMSATWTPQRRKHVRTRAKRARRTRTPSEGRSVRASRRQGQNECEPHRPLAPAREFHGLSGARARC
jgi:hypothetical protein